MHTMIVRRLIGWVLVFCISAIASADGLYSQLHNALSHPELPYQRALISHRNGVETLIVESELKGPKGDYAWIVPVPNPPTKVLEVNSESLERDFDRANPEFVAYQSVWPFGVFGILLLISALVAARNPSRKRVHFLLWTQSSFTCSWSSLLSRLWHPRHTKASQLSAR